MKEKIKKEAEKRIKELTEKYHLNPNILKYFKEGRVYYSYLTAYGMIGSIDTISYDKRYEDAVKEFEEKYEGYMVYHAIEDITEFGEMLSLLYVSTHEEEWEFERCVDDYIASYTINFTNPDCSEFGDIIVSRFEDSGALIRIG